MKQEETKAMLQYGAIQTVAHEGLEKTSTKLIAYEANVNEVFIFRYYAGKDNLLDETFLAMDNAIAEESLLEIRACKMLNLPTETKIRALVTRLWDKYIEKKNEVLFFTRFMNSASFLRVASLRHREVLNRLAIEAGLTFDTETVGEYTMLHLSNLIINVILQAQLDETGSASRHKTHAVNFLTDAILSGLRQGGAVAMPGTVYIR